MLSSTFWTGLSLVDAYFDPTILQNEPEETMAALLGGFYTQQSQEVDIHVIDEVRNFLFGTFFRILAQLLHLLHRYNPPHNIPFQLFCLIVQELPKVKLDTIWLV
jgi:hypothetical protein